MPCDRIYEQSVDLGQCDQGSLIEALKELGYSYVQQSNGILIGTEFGNAVIQDGSVVMRGSVAGNAEVVAGTIKRAVSAVVIKKAAAKFGWSVTHNKVTNKIKLKR